MIRTDKEGRFKFDQLESGERYLVIAADNVYERGIYLTPRIIGPLKPGRNSVRLRRAF